LNDFEAFRCEGFTKNTRFLKIFLENWRRIGGKKSEAFIKILNTFSMELGLFESDVRLSKSSRLFKLFPAKWRFFSLIWDILKDFEAFKKKLRFLFRNARFLNDIFKDVEAFLN
jgi:hypothetical protein